VHDEAAAVARKLGAAGAALLVVDTEAAYMGSTLARRVAEAAGGRYWRLPNASDGVLAAAAAAFARRI
jgi:magnesium chelatase subunit D